MITEQQAGDIARSAFRLRTALVRNGFPNEAGLLVAYAMPAIVQVVCAVPGEPPAGLSDVGPRDETLADAGERSETGPCAATQVYGPTGCT